MFFNCARVYGVPGDCVRVQEDRHHQEGGGQPGGQRNNPSNKRGSEPRRRYWVAHSYVPIR